MKKILILGIGNILMGDEGVGVHTIKALGEKSLSEDIDMLDGGTGGFHLMAYFQEYECYIKEIIYITEKCHHDKIPFLYFKYIFEYTRQDRTFPLDKMIYGIKSSPHITNIGKKYLVDLCDTP